MSRELDTALSAARKAGGRLTNYRGDVLDLAGREIVASNGCLHAAITRLQARTIDVVVKPYTYVTFRASSLRYEY